MEKLKLPGVFELLDFSFSHSVILFRNQEWIEDAPYNTDILFSLTFYIEVPTKLYNITINSGTLRDCEYVRMQIGKSHYAHPIYPDNIFVITSRKKKYYIGARVFEILNNKYEMGETSIGLKRK